VSAATQDGKSTSTDINVHDDITRRQKPDAVRSMSDISQRHAALNTLPYSGLLLLPPYVTRQASGFKDLMAKARSVN